ncbi:MAG: HEAT repeat domain-containing protein [Cyanobacteria bacterium J06635_10]
MSQSLNSKSPVVDEKTLEIQAENDKLLEMSKEQIGLKTFDSTNEKLIKQMIEGMGDTRGMIRLGFAQALGEIGKPATPLLTETLANHSNVVVRRAAAKTLTIISDPNAVPSLVHSFLNDEDTVVRGSSAGALARTGEVAAPALLDILASTEYSQDIKGHAAWALAFMGSKASEHLYKALNDASLDVRCAVIGALGNVAKEESDEKTCNLLVSSLKDPEALIRTEAAAALGQVNYPPAVEHLITASQDSDLDVRKAAINSLGKIGSSTAMEALQTMLNDEQEVVRILAKLAIAQIERQSQANDW